MTPPIRMVSVPRSAVERLILAADSYGVRYLDSDDLTETAQELQDATEAMKDALTAAPVREEGGAVEALKTRIAELEAQVFVPGLHRCAKCGCKTVCNTLNATTGTIRADSKPQACPNGCGPMWPVTEREAGNEMADRLDALATREEAPAEAGEIGAEYDAAAHCVTLAECPPGLFLWNGTLGFKSEYGAVEHVGISPHHQQWKVGNRADAYCADSGEYFWGGTSNHDDRAKLLVYPIAAETVAMVASHGPSALRAQPQARSGEGQ